MRSSPLRIVRAQVRGLVTLRRVHSRPMRRQELADSGRESGLKEALAKGRSGGLSASRERCSGIGIPLSRSDTAGVVGNASLEQGSESCLSYSV